MTTLPVEVSAMVHATDSTSWSSCSSCVAMWLAMRLWTDSQYHV